jgi:UDP-glucose 4-epimerase
MRNVLVTGGTGRLGRFVCAALAVHHNVTMLDLRPLPGFRGVVGDIRDFPTVVRAAEGCDVVVHLAAIPSPRHGCDEDIISTNVLGAWSVLQAALMCGAKRAVLCSSDFVTGLLHRDASVMPLYLPIDEAYPVAPVDAYGLSKHLAEQTAAAFARRSLEVVVLRPGLVVFPEAELDAMRRGSSIDNPDLWWYASAADVAEAFRLAVEIPSLPATTFFVGAPDTLARVPTLDLVLQRFGRLPEIRNAALYRDNPFAAVFDTSLARRLLGFHHSRNWRTWNAAVAFR